MTPAGNGDELLKSMIVEVAGCEPVATTARSKCRVSFGGWYRLRSYNEQLL